MVSQLKTLIQELEEWARHKALPFWADTAQDEQGGWYEDLSLNREPNTEKIRRLRVQARQIYVYSVAHKMKWYSGHEIIPNSLGFMTQYGLSPDTLPGFIHLLASDYSISNNKRDLYDHAFYLLACGWAYHATGERRALTLANEIADFIDYALLSPNGGWRESSEGNLPRRQNPHMHLFEACLALYDITKEKRWMNYAHRIFNLFEIHFFDPKNHAINEFFEDDWKIITGLKGQSVEPGHAAEWVWLLKLYEDYSGVDTSDYAEKLYNRICASKTVFLNDKEHIDGSIIRSTKRLWVQTEFIKAHIAQMARGNTHAENRAVATIKTFFECYLEDNGTWVDQIDNNGLSISTTIPTSTFYHVMCMIHGACEHALIRD